MGILWAREDLLSSLHSYKVRPLPEKLPDKYQPGTPQLELLAAMESCIHYFAWLGGRLGAPDTGRTALQYAYEGIRSWEAPLTCALLNGIAKLDGAAICGITDQADMAWRVPTVSFTHAELPSIQIAQKLAEQNIFVWSGHNFALETARSLGLNEQDGVVRIGLAHYNTADEVEAVLTSLNRVIAG